MEPMITLGHEEISHDHHILLEVGKEKRHRKQVANHFEHLENHGMTIQPACSIPRTSCQGSHHALLLQ